jgi:foldase protein PrsA
MFENQDSTLNNQQKVAAGSKWVTIVPWVLFVITAIAFATYFIVQVNGPGVSAGNVGNEAVAKIDDETITANDVYQLMLSQVGSQAVEALITERLIQREASSENIKATEEDLDAEIEKIKANFGSEDEFIQQLEASGLTMENLRKQLSSKVLLDKLIAPKINITDEDMKTYYDQNKESFNTPEEVKASHILVETKQEADEILALLKSGSDFATLAKERSKDGSAAQGGDLGYFGRGQMVAPFEEAAFTLNVGEISKVVESEFGFHIIKVIDKKAATTASFNDKKEDIRKTLTEQKQGELSQTFIEELRTAAKIENYFKKETETETKNP